MRTRDADPLAQISLFILTGVGFDLYAVIPAKAGIQANRPKHGACGPGCPQFAGMTEWVRVKAGRCDCVPKRRDALRFSAPIVTRCNHQGDAFSWGKEA